MMKQILGLCLLSLSLTSCGFTSVSKKELIGKWDNHIKFEERTLRALGATDTPFILWGHYRS